MRYDTKRYGMILYYTVCCGFISVGLHFSNEKGIDCNLWVYNIKCRLVQVCGIFKAKSQGQVLVLSPLKRISFFVNKDCLNADSSDVGDFLMVTVWSKRSPTSVNNINLKANWKDFTANLESWSVQLAQHCCEMMGYQSYGKYYIDLNIAYI